MARTQRFLNRKLFYTLLTVIMLAGISYVVYSYNTPIPNPGHGGDMVLVSINGSEKTLQQAIDAGDFRSGGSTGGGSTGGGGNDMLYCKQALANGLCDANLNGGIEDYAPVSHVGNQCCAPISRNNLQFRYLTIGVNHVTSSNNDCWIFDTLTSSCGQVFNIASASISTCTAAVLSWYNTLNIQGVTGGWASYGGSDTGANSPCVTSNSDIIKIVFGRPLPSP